MDFNYFSRLQPIQFSNMTSRSRVEPIRQNLPAFDDEEDGLDSYLGQSRFGPSTQKYLDFIKAVPTQADYKPSKFRRVIAALSGLGQKDPYGTARSIVEQPYQNALEQWARQGSTLKEAAGLENEDAQFRLKSLLDYRKNQAQKQLDWAKYSNDVENTNINRDIANAYIGDFEARRPTYAANVRNIDSLIADRINNSRYRDILGKATQDNVEISRGRLGLDRDKLNLDQSQFNWDKSLGNPRNISPLLSGLGSFIRSTSPETYAPRYISPKDQEMIDQQAATDLLNENPDYEEYFDDYGQLKESEVPAALLPSIKSKLEQKVKARSSRQFGR